MKFLRKLLPAIVIFLIVFLVFSFFHIDGREIRNINKLDESWDVSVYVNQDNEETHEYQLTGEQIIKLRELLRQNHYTRRLSNTIIGALPDTNYSILADIDNNSKTLISIRMIGGEYISFSRQFGDHYHKIKNPEFEQKLIEILES